MTYISPDMPQDIIGRAPTEESMKNSGSFFKEMFREGSVSEDEEYYRKYDADLSTSINISSLHRIRSSEWEHAVQMMLRAFRDYPKLRFVFPRDVDRQAGIEAVIRYYGSYDMYHGAAFSLDDSLHECAVLLHSDMMGFTQEQIRVAGCENDAWRAALQRLDSSQQQTWFAFFEAFDREEAKLDLPEEYLYLDFLAVAPDWQHRGRGRRLMDSICDYADEQGLPLILFTNTEEDIRFYKSFNFQIVGITESEDYGFHNTYMVRD